MRLVPPDVAVTLTGNVPEGVWPGGPCDVPLPPPQEISKVPTVSKPSVTSPRIGLLFRRPAASIRPKTGALVHHQRLRLRCCWLLGKAAKGPVVLSVMLQRNFEPLQRQVETWRKTQITDERAKLIFYNAFIDGVEPRAVTPHVTDEAVWCDQFVTNRPLQTLTETSPLED